MEQDVLLSINLKIVDYCNLNDLDYVNEMNNLTGDTLSEDEISFLEEVADLQKQKDIKDFLDRDF